MSGRTDAGATGAVARGAGPTRAVARGAGPTVNPWVELLRLPALFTVPGDALAGAAAAGARPTPRTLLAIASSLCLYEAGMALNDWADRAEDAVDRPHRPLPSGRIKPPAALAAAGGLTAAGLALASGAGRRPLAVAGALAATVWSYDLVLKRTPAGPAAMATARALDLLLGGAATDGNLRTALPSALALGTHTLSVTTVSRNETQGGSPWAPLGGLATTAALAWSLSRDGQARGQGRGEGQGRDRGRRRSWGQVQGQGQGQGHRQGQVGTSGRATAHGATGAASRTAVPGVAAPAPTPWSEGAPTAAAWNGAPPRGTPWRGAPPRAAVPRVAPVLRGALAAAYAATAARPLFHAALNPSPPLTQRAVGGGIRAMIPLQAALAARSGAPLTALLTAALAPAARRFGRRVSVT